MAEGNRSVAEHDIEVVGCSKAFGPTRVLADVSFGVRRGEFVSVLGPSGCGKTTTLRIIGGYLKPDGGEVSIRGRQVTLLPPHLRNIGVVFQNYALWPHMTAFDNVAFGLRIRRLPRAEVQDRAARALALVRLRGLADRYPRQLSGGEQQRVALARAFALEPQVVLFDEPLSNLDRKLREDMRVELKTLQQSLGLTSLYVTHDQEEALSLSDRVIVMSQGRIQQIGSPREIYERPANRFVAGFIGFANFLDGRVTTRMGDRAAVDLRAGGQVETDCPAGVAVGDDVVLIVRPEHLDVTTTPPVPPGRAITGRVNQVIYEGAALRYALGLAGYEDRVFFAQGTPAADALRPGERVYARIRAAAIVGA